MLAAFTFLAVAMLPATASGQMHGPGFLAGPGPFGEKPLNLLGTTQVTSRETKPDLVADVAVDPDGEVAYLANWGEPDCAANAESGLPDAGVWVIDISNVESLPEVDTVEEAFDFPIITFIPHSQDSRPGEGMQVVDIDTKWFTGEMLVMNNEQCGKNGKGGVSLYDVTDPAKPRKLSEHFGDRNPGDVNDIHSAFAWQDPATGRAYVVMTDNAEATDVDILDITNPHRPRLIADLNLNQYCGPAIGEEDGRIDQPEIGVTESSLHDMIVKQIGGNWIMLLSYWDGGFVTLNVNDPANPVCLDDTEYTNPDPELLESTGISLPPEGNAHQAEYTVDNRFFIGTDEDFSPYRAIFTIDTGGPGVAGEYPAGEFGWTEPIVEQPGRQVSGLTVYGGYGCPQSTEDVPTADEVRARADVPDDATLILVLQRGPVEDPSANYEACFFSEKVEFAQNLGYDAAIVANHHVGAQAGDAPDAQFCGSQGHEFTPTIPAVCIGHRAMHLLFGDEPDYSVPYSGTEPAIGTVGQQVTMRAAFDGWGYVHLFDAATGEELDTYAIDEAHDEEMAFGHGEFTVHEVATDPQNASLAYISYYSGGMRVVQIQCGGVPYDPANPPADTSTCELVEVGGYLDPMGNDFWGVEAFVGDDGRTYVLGSDMDYGLWVFVDP
ncbi:MAG: hypothetical protein ICV69_08830 [Thermoleophilaceae bacterium]|nr:hypothetical protein [Thermoleophilaceae bacterium]